MNIPQTTTAPVCAASSNAVPEFSRLPSRGPERWTGLCRSTILALEKAGAFRLIRVRKQGHQRGVVLIPVERVCSYLRSQAVT
jgi:hypothetical protein